MDLVEVVKEKDKLEEISNLAVKAYKLKEQLNALLKTLRTVYGSKSQISPLVEDVLKRYTPPPLKGGEYELAANGLKEYVEDVDRKLRQLSNKINQIDYVSKLLDKIDLKANELKKWAKLVKQVSPYQYMEALKAVDKYEKLIGSISAGKLDDLVASLAILGEELDHRVKVCKNAYFKRIKEIKKELDIAFKMLGKARATAALEERAEVDAIASKLKSIAEKLENTWSKAPEYEVDIKECREEVRKSIERLKQIVSKTFTESEVKVLEAVNRIANVYKERSIPLTAFFEYVSRNTELDMEDAYRITYLLAKRGAVRIEVRVS